MKARAVGPAGMSGRITAIDVVESNPEIIYAGWGSNERRLLLTFSEYSCPRMRFFGAWDIWKYHLQICKLLPLWGQIVVDSFSKSVQCGSVREQNGDDDVGCQSQEIRQLSISVNKIIERMRTGPKSLSKSFLKQRKKFPRLSTGTGVPVCVDIQWLYMTILYHEEICQNCPK